MTLWVPFARGERRRVLSFLPREKKEFCVLLSFSRPLGLLPLFFDLPSRGVGTSCRAWFVCVFKLCYKERGMRVVCLPGPERRGMDREMKL